MDRLWTTAAHDYAETRVSTHPCASNLITGIAALTTLPLNQIGPLPRFVRNAEVGSSSLLPSTNLRSPVYTRSLSAVARQHKFCRAEADLLSRSELRFGKPSSPAGLFVVPAG